MIHVRGHINYWTGFGRLAVEVGLGLSSRGWPVRFSPRAIDERNQPLPPGVRERIGRPGAGDSVLAVDGVRFIEAAGRPTAAFTMWEAAGLPAGLARAMNSCEVVLTPSRFCAAVFSAAGVTAPIRIVPLGVDPSDFAEPDPGPPRGQVVFGCAGWVSKHYFRKGLDDVIAAFRAAFPKGDGVRLKVKVWPGCVVSDAGGDRRVEIDRSPLSRQGLIRWYRSLNCFVSASRGEGWGLCVHEALAAGRPVIATDWSGHGELVSPDAGLVLPYRLEPCTDNDYGGVGTWARPDFDAMVAAMREAAASPDALASRAAPGIERAGSMTWARCVEGTAEALAEFGFSPESSGYNPRPDRRIFVRRRGSIGDVLACEPAIRAIRDANHGGRIVIQTACAGAAALLPGEAEIQEIGPTPPGCQLFDLGGSYERCLDRPRQLAICEAAGVTYPGPSRCRLTKEGDDTAAVFRRDRRPLIVVCGYAHWSCRRWEDARWSELASLLARRRLRVVEVCEPGRSVGAGEPFHGTLAQAAGVIAAASCWVGVDSGPMWIALGLGVPTVALFGATTPSLVSDHPNLVPVTAESAENGCHHRPPYPKDRCLCNRSRHPAMEEIRVQDVLEKIMGVIG